MSALRDLTFLAPDEARRIIREAYALEDCSIVRTARALGVAMSTMCDVVGILGLREELRTMRTKLRNRFADPEAVVDHKVSSPRKVWTVRRKARHA